MPPLIRITGSYILWSKFKKPRTSAPFIADTSEGGGGGHKLARKHSVKRKAYIKLKGTQGTERLSLYVKKNGGGAGDRAPVDKSLPTCRFTVLE